MEELGEFLFDEDNCIVKNDLICDICHDILSVGPIMYSNDIGNICGRNNCNKLISELEANRQITYEIVAKYLIFPCKYINNGCKFKLRWGEVLKHEDTCKFMKYNCPLLKKEYLREGEEKCNSISRYDSSFFRHLEEKHKEHFFSNSLVLDLKRDFTKYTRELYFTKIRKDITIIVLINISNSSTSLTYEVYASNVIPKKLKYYIKITDSFKSESTYWSRKKYIDPLHLDSWNKKLNDCLTIDLNHIQHFLDDASFAILEFEYENVKIGYSLQKEEPLYGFYKTGLKEQKCSYCKQNLNYPICSCNLGVNICNRCLKNSNFLLCLRCKMNTRKETNLFELLMELVDEPCKYNSQGCTFAGPRSITQDHENICDFKKKTCSFCNVQFDDIIEHIQEKHRGFIMLSNKRYPFTFVSEANHLYILFDGQIFKIFFKCTQENFELQVECLGLKQLRYMYEFRMLDSEYLDFSIKWTHICYPDGIDLAKHGIHKFLKIPRNVIGQILPNTGRFEISIEIFKVKLDEIVIPYANINEQVSETTNLEIGIGTRLPHRRKQDEI